MRVQDSLRILKNPARMPQCRPIQLGTSQPKAVYNSAPKLVPACSSGQLRSQRRHQSYGSNYRQSKFDSQGKRKDSSYHAAAAEPGDAYYAQEDEEKLDPNEANAYYYVQSPEDSAVKAWLIDPFT